MLNEAQNAAMQDAEELSKVEQKSSQVLLDEEVSSNLPNIAENCTYDQMPLSGLEPETR